MTPTIEYAELDRPAGRSRMWIVVVRMGEREWCHTFDADQHKDALAYAMRSYQDEAAEWTARHGQAN